jgi:hypothetical protein
MTPKVQQIIAYRNYRLIFHENQFEFVGEKEFFVFMWILRLQSVSIVFVWKLRYGFPIS